MLCATRPAKKVGVCIWGRIDVTLSRMCAKKKTPTKKKAAKKKTPKRRRKKIPPQVETQVLVESKYRCCLCYSLDRDDSEKLGQIAHIDRNPSNNKITNLAFLCHDHHSRYDSKSLQSKGITEGVLRASLETLKENLRLKEEKSVTVTLTLDREFESFTDEEYAELIAEVRKAAKTKGNITKLSISRGSVKVKLEVSGEDAVRILQAFEQERLSSLGVTKIEYPQGIQTGVRVFKEFDSQLGVLTKDQILSVVSNPDYSQYVLDGKPKSRLLVKDDFPNKGFATLAFVASGKDDSWLVMRGLLIPRDALSSWPIERPRDLLREFAEKFGISLPRFDNKKIVFDETIPLICGPVSDALVRALDFKRPETMFYNAVPKESVIGGRSIWFEVACKIGESYAVALQQRGFKIDLEKWRNREHMTFYW